MLINIGFMPKVLKLVGGLSVSIVLLVGFAIFYFFPLSEESFAFAKFSNSVEFPSNVNKQKVLSYETCLVNQTKRCCTFLALS